MIVGSYPPFADIRSITVGEGRFYNWNDEAESRKVAFLGTEVKKQLFAGRQALGENVYINDIPYKVIGVMKAKDQDSSYDGFDVNKIFIPYSAIHEDFPNKPPSKPHGLDRLWSLPRRWLGTAHARARFWRRWREFMVSILTTPRPSTCGTPSKKPRPSKP